MTKSLSEKLKDMLRECENASPGPWKYNGIKTFHNPGSTDWGFMSLKGHKHEDARFIEMARTQLPAALRALLTAWAGLAVWCECSKEGSLRTMCGYCQIAEEIEKEFVQ